MTDPEIPAARDDLDGGDVPDLGTDVPEPEELVDKDEIDEDDEMELTGEDVTE